MKRLIFLTIYIFLIIKSAAAESYLMVQPVDNTNLAKAFTDSSLIDDNTGVIFNENTTEIPASSTNDINLNSEDIVDPLETIKPQLIKLEISKFDPEEITFADFLYEAVNENLAFQDSKINSKIANWKFWQQFASALPDVQANFGLRDLNGTFYLNSAFQTEIDEVQGFYNFGINYRAFNGGKTTLLTLAERYLRESQNKILANDYYKLVYESIVIYNDLLKEQLSLEFYRKAFLEAKTNSKLAKNKYDTGIGTKYDYLVAQTRLAETKQQLITAESRHRIAQTIAAKHLNQNQDKQYYINSEQISALNLTNQDLDFEEIKAYLAEHNQQILAKADQMKAFRRQLYASYGDFLPKVDAFYTFGSTGEDLGDINDLHTLGFQVSLEFGKSLGLSSVSKVKLAEKNLEQAKNQAEQLNQNLESELRQTYLKIQSNRLAISEARARLEAAREALKISQARYDSGLDLINDLLDSEKQLSSAEQNLVITTNLYNKAEAYLAYLLGDLELVNLKS
jgi:outer membrane protein TolC